MKSVFPCKSCGEFQNGSKTQESRAVSGFLHEDTVLNLVDRQHHGMFHCVGYGGGLFNVLTRLHLKCFLRLLTHAATIVGVRLIEVGVKLLAIPLCAVSQCAAQVLHQFGAVLLCEQITVGIARLLEVIGAVDF